MAAGLTEQEKRDLQFVFNVYDPKQKGVISPDDVVKAMTVLGFSQSRDVIESLMSQQSASSEGKGTGVSYEDFLQIVVSCQGDSYDMHEEITRGFTLMDKDKDGYITLKDLRTLCNELNLVLREEELDDMIFEADSDGDGKVSKEEFVQIMLRTSLYADHV